MLFNSLSFLVFATLFFGGYFFVNRSSNNLRWSFVTLFSLIFYGWWDWRYLSLLLLSGLIDFFAAILIHQNRGSRKMLLVISMTSNLLILGAFKYAFFFCGAVNRLTNLFFESSIDCMLPGFFTVLPVGISFYTFQSMSYTIDVYRGRLIPTNNVLHFFAFLSLFPQLVAGPIVRASDLLPQLKVVKPVPEVMRWHGLKLIALGYFKKTVLADNIGPFVNNAFSNEVSNSSTIYWWVVMIAFSFQIYCDFSGYTDIARGLSKWMGIHFRVNFNHPYLATSFRQFWQRWHISLSTWFRDYVYIPLGGSKKGQLSGLSNLWITMLLSGLWHGAGFTFIIWGALHALYLTMERLVRKIVLISIPRAVSIPLIFLLVTVAWVFFRSESLSQAAAVFNHLFTFTTPIEWGNAEVFQQARLFIVLAITIELFVWIRSTYSSLTVPKSLYRIVDGAVVAGLLLGSIFLRGSSAQFVYFQF